MSRLAVFVATLSLPLTGCFSAELDPDLGGVFTCDEDEACPDQMRCVSRRCLTEEQVPRLEILSPSPDEAISLEDASMLETFRIEATANFEVIDEPGEYEPGLGLIEMRLGFTEIKLKEQTPEGTLIFEVTGLEPTPGPVRLTLGAADPTGQPFDNDEARVRRLFWIDDGRPHIALTSPWPNETLPASPADDVRFEVAAINFALVPPGDPPMEGMGHAHFFFEAPPELCNPILRPQGVSLPDAEIGAGLEDCFGAGGYEILNQPVEGLNRVFSIATLPGRPVGRQPVTATLQQNDHLVALFPKPSGGFVAELDQININRE